MKCQNHPYHHAMLEVPLKTYSRWRHARAFRSLALIAGATIALSCFAHTASRAADHSATNPFAAHNAYPYRLLPDKQKFQRALDAGLKYVEVDVTYDPMRQAIVATHDSTPRGNEPELGELIAPMWERWAKVPAEDHYTLVIDFKSVSPEIVEAFKKVIEPHAELLSRLPKSAGGKFEPRQITICLTGDTAAHRIYADSIPADGEYLAFGDHGSGAWKQNIADYVPSEPAGFVRFLTYEKQTFMDAADAKGNEHISPERIKAAVRLANERGYRIRVYTVNPPRRGGVLDDAYWSASVDGGVHMIATDAYEIARDWWNERAEKAAPATQP